MLALPQSSPPQWAVGCQRALCLQGTRLGMTPALPLTSPAEGPELTPSSKQNSIYLRGWGWECERLNSLAYNQRSINVRFTLHVTSPQHPVTLQGNASMSEVNSRQDENLGTFHSRPIYFDTYYWVSCIWGTCQLMISFWQHPALLEYSVQLFGY